MTSWYASLNEENEQFIQLQLLRMWNEKKNNYFMYQFLWTSASNI